ncbi:MAG: hypothetical protein R2831_01945 [Chitinophagaceae bacterium]
MILPLALPINYTFGVPVQWQPSIQVGMRVEVQFGKKRMYSGIVKKIHFNKPDVYEVKPIKSILDKEPIVSEKTIQFWVWLASYYMCSEGEVMNASLPSYLKLDSETFVSLQTEVPINELDLSDDEYIVMQALFIKNEKNKKP